MDLNFYNNFINSISEEFYYRTRFDSSSSIIRCSIDMGEVNLNFNRNCTMLALNKCSANNTKSQEILLEIIKRRLTQLDPVTQSVFMKKLNIPNLSFNLQEAEFVKGCKSASSVTNAVRLAKLDYICNSTIASNIPSIKIINSGNTESDCIFDSLFQKTFPTEIDPIAFPIQKEYQINFTDILIWLCLLVMTFSLFFIITSNLRFVTTRVNTEAFILWKDPDNMEILDKIGYEKIGKIYKKNKELLYF
ncbi:putative membrane protein [Carp edema virus]|nr:putative membrane protein [Carp edema virus]